MKNLFSKPTSILVLFLFLGLIACADLTIIDLFAPSNANAGATINTSCTIKNIGDLDATVSKYALYLSQDPYRDLNDVELGNWEIQELTIGANAKEEHTVQIPSDVYSGKYYLVAVADADRKVAEAADTRHNDRAYRTIEISGAPNTGIDLVATNVFHPTVTDGGAEINLYYTVHNAGQTNASGSRVKYYFSKNAVYEPGTDINLGTQIVGSVKSEEGRELQKKMTMPANLPTGFYHVILRVDADNGVGEYNEENNDYVFKVYLRQPTADLNPTVFNVAPETKPGQSIASNFYVLNNGFKISETQTTAFYLSKNASLDASDQFLDAIQMNSINAVSGLSLSHNIPIPANTPEGSYYVFIVVDDTDLVAESDENNNFLSAKICIHDGNPIAGASPNNFITLSPGVLTEPTLQKRKENKEEFAATMKAYPNPTHDILNLILDLEEEESLDLVVSDLSGKTLKSYSGTLGGGNISQIDLSYLPTGTYIVHAKVGDQQFVEKVVVK